MANFKRRLLQYITQPREIILNIQMLFIMVINIIVLNTIMNIIYSMLSLDADTVDNLKKLVLNGALPLILQIAVYLSSGLYVITVVKDREDNLRRLLHLSGMRPLAYYLGLFLGDLILINIPATLAIVIAAVLQVQTFIDHFGAFIGSLFLFSLSFLPFNYLISFYFKSVEKAFKY